MIHMNVGLVGWTPLGALPYFYHHHRRNWQHSLPPRNSNLSSHLRQQSLDPLLHHFPMLGV